MRQHCDWQRDAAELTLRDQAYINGHFVTAVDGATLPSVNPATRQVLANVTSCGEAEINNAVAAARASFNQGTWSQTSPAQRKAVLLKLADLLAERADTFALTDTLDMGKPIAETTAIDLPGTIDCLRWTAEAIDKVYGEIAPTGHDALALISREPVGVVAAITPWNYPLMMAMWKLAPALACGNSVVLKPSEKSPLSALLLAELASEAGLPDGVLNVVPGLGEIAGKALALHKDVQVLTFTGSTRVAGLLMQYAGQSNLKRVWLEAGGKSPNIIFDDCEDLETAAKTTAAAIFSNQGEVCIAGSRLYLHKSIKQRFLQLLQQATAAYQPGDPLDPETLMGPLVDQQQLETVQRYIDSAISEGGQVISGGIPELTEHGFFAAPTIIDQANNQMRCVREEIFGPVLSVIEFSDEAEAITLANDSDYGLGACVWSDNLKRAHRVAKQIKSGMVWVNGWADGDQTVPFGGIKGSGNGRDKSLHALEKYTELKTTWFRL